MVKLWQASHEEQKNSKANIDIETKIQYNYSMKMNYNNERLLK